MLSDVYCTGDETALDQCAYTFYSLSEGKTLLPQVQVAGASCLPLNCIPPSNIPGSACPSNTIQLNGGDGSSYGNLMYCYNGNLSPVCQLDPAEASVACRSLGFTTYDCELKMRIIKLFLPFLFLSYIYNNELLNVIFYRGYDY